VASFDRAIPPGAEGKVNLLVRTKGYQGKIRKTATVYTNDPSMPTFILEVRAHVQVAIVVAPPNVDLTGREGETVTRVVMIKAGLDKPLRLTPDRFTLAEKVKYVIEEKEEGRQYRVLFTSLPGPPGSYYGTLELKTNYPEREMIVIRVRGRLKQASR
jgi:hypothetical protein